MSENIDRVNDSVEQDRRELQNLVDRGPLAVAMAYFQAVAQGEIESRRTYGPPPCARRLIYDADEGIALGGDGDRGGAGFVIALAQAQAQTRQAEALEGILAELRRLRETQVAQAEAVAGIRQGLDRLTGAVGEVVPELRGLYRETTRVCDVLVDISNAPSLAQLRPPD